MKKTKAKIKAVKIESYKQHFAKKYSVKTSKAITSELYRFVLAFLVASKEISQLRNGFNFFLSIATSL